MQFSHDAVERDFRITKGKLLLLLSEFTDER